MATPPPCQYYTTSDPFGGSDAFRAWYAMVPQDEPVLEPFAGAGHLFSYVRPARGWQGYDLHPRHPRVQRRDTLQSFPAGFRVCITNPPYLSKTMASRKGLGVRLAHEDLYLDALDLCLEHCEFVAAVVPSVFWNQALFKERLYAWDKLDRKVFSDTDAAAGVGYFVPHPVGQPRAFVNGREVHLTAATTPRRVAFEVVFNPPTLAPVICHGVDSVAGDEIRLCALRDDDVPRLLDARGGCKSTNRVHFGVAAPALRERDLPALNAMIRAWREETRDFHLSSFLCPMRSGRYRKRLSFVQLRWLLAKFYDGPP